MHAQKGEIARRQHHSLVPGGTILFGHKMRFCNLEREAAPGSIHIGH
jgi:hypothetical protein